MQKPKILVVDDDANLVWSLAIRLRHEGYDVLTGLNGYHGLAEAIEEAPDLLILDINMPAGDGFSIQDRLQKINCPHSPVIYLTGDRSLRAELTAKRLGAFAVVHKPFDMVRLLKTVKRALDSASQKSR